MSEGTPGTVHDTARLQPVRHDAHVGCGERIPCPACGEPFGPFYRPAELLRNGDVVSHCCGQRWRADDLRRRTGQAA